MAADRHLAGRAPHANDNARATCAVASPAFPPEPSDTFGVEYVESQIAWDVTIFGDDGGRPCLVDSGHRLVR